MNTRLATSPVLCALLTVLFGAAPAFAGVSAALTPATQTVAPGSDFDLFLDVTEPGSPFNGYDVVVSYDPAALTFLPLSPTTLQQGCLMTGACSASCGNTFHVFSAAGDSLKVNNVLLCNQIALAGPGHLYKLRFHASDTPQATQVTIRHMRFVNAGLFVNPVTTADCVVGIGVAVGVNDVPAASGGGVRVEPNPARGRVAFVADAAGGEITQVEVLDLLGRRVRQLSSAGAFATGAWQWDGTNASGARVPPGVYLARVHRSGRVQYSRFVLLP